MKQSGDGRRDTKRTRWVNFTLSRMIDLGSNDRFGLQSTVRTAKEPNFLEQLTGMRGAHFPLSAASPSAPSGALRPV